GGPMGLFDELLRNTIGSQASDPSSQSRSLLGGLVSMLEDPSVGGVDGLVRQFEQHGLGGEAKSWIGTGANRAITPARLSRALGRQRVESLSNGAGLGSAAGAAAMAALLPVLIDKLTPQGRAPQAGSNLSGLLGSLLGGGGSARAASDAPPAKPRA